MVRIRRLTAASLILIGAFLGIGSASAGPLWDWFCGVCPPPANYCPARYWAPRLARTYDCLCGPHIRVYPPERHPEIPPTMNILKYPCPPAPPEATLYAVPTPPEDSRFQYFERLGPATAGIGLPPEKK